MFVGLVLGVLASGLAFAQEETKKKEDPYEQICKLVKAEYIAPAKAGAAQMLRLTVDVHPDVPKDAKINLELEYQGLPVKNPYDFVLKSNRRKGLVLNWKLKDRLAIDEYRLRARMYMKAQPPSVKRKLRSMERKFPPKFEPWPYYFFSQPIQIGSQAELAAERKQTCDSYNHFVDQLIDNMIELNKAMGQARDGQVYVDGGTLNQEKFAKFVGDWRKKQGEVQKAILNFPETHAAAFQKTKTAYVYLMQLGQMVSKSSWQQQQEISKKYNAPLSNPTSHPNFDRSFRYKVNREALNKQLKRITDLVCPPEPEPKPAEPASAEAAKDGDEKPKKKSSKKKKRKRKKKKKPATGK